MQERFRPILVRPERVNCRNYGIGQGCSIGPFNRCGPLADESVGTVVQRAAKGSSRTKSVAEHM